MVAQGTLLRNAFNGESFIFSAPLPDPRRAAFDIVLDESGSGGGNALVHVHPHAEETFLVKAGRLIVVVRGAEHSLLAGESLTVPVGTPHYFKNGGAAPVEATVTFEPAQQHLRFFANFARLTIAQPEWFSAKGDPNLLLIALTLHTYPDHLYLAGPPVILQKWLFALLAVVARWRGYRMEIMPDLA